MADHLWFIPATAGGPYLPHAPGTGPVQRAADFNVQWDTSYYPTDQATNPEHPFFEVEAVTQFDTAVGATSETPGKLRHCFAQFRWDSCTDGSDITLGGQLNVGTVFSRALPTGNSASQTFTLYNVEVWAKVRVDDLAKLDSIYLVISDDSGNPNNSGNRIADFTNNTWHVIRWFVTNPDGWDNTNLRATLSVLGTTNTARVGRVKVDIEWFAFGLTAV